MGTVYRATHLGLQRSVAVKIIKSEFADDTDVADRFMREARTMAKLRHPRAAMIFDAGNLPDGRHFIIMEFIEGTTLSEALGARGPLLARTRHQYRRTGLRSAGRSAPAGHHSSRSETIEHHA